MRVVGVGMCVCGVGGILILDRRLGCCVAVLYVLGLSDSLYGYGV